MKKKKLVQLMKTGDAVYGQTATQMKQTKIMRAIEYNYSKYTDHIHLKAQRTHFLLFFVFLFEQHSSLFIQK